MELGEAALAGVGVITEAWRGRRVLVTGHTGFKGAWLCRWLERAGAQVVGLGLAPEDHGAFTALAPWELDHRIRDVRDARGLHELMAEAQPEAVFHLAAQALVRRGYAAPAHTFAVNVAGTANVLEAAARVPTTKAVVVVTSDKVYAQPGPGRPFVESDPLGGDDPYSASKAAAEMACAAWRGLGPPGMALATARSGNVVGGGDVAEDRLLPDVRRALRAGQPVELRHPEATRPWQFVLDPLAGYLLLAEHLLGGGCGVPAVNFGPDEGCHPVESVVDAVLAAWGGGSWRHDPGASPPEAQALSLDATLARKALGWRPLVPLDEALAWTVEWWRAERDGGDLRSLADAQIAAYEERSR